ncbi:TetR/AcrR family transcriptional regulator [Gordonia aichiensis]|uniref:Putative TetR family transcriptional regulator n=1 Tax=Gordonia aichiensis NBRC 108223 TaxID=1220583 RepID=L7KJ83_9ACTN|nr:hypothetical protein [Gordonia aichiensis]GAC48669.1 putative TetR family transcriptional regulator [Gordonia aichiensis NBRC 108223]
MPRIKAGSVAEHRAAVMTQLLDGTERLLLSGADATLTAAGIAAEAGIARNSIYRYVSSVDDLIEMVLERGFTDWSTAVAARVAHASDPRTAILTYAEANLEFAADGRHAWRTAIARIHLSDNARSRVMALHEQITATLHEAVNAVGVVDTDLTEATIAAIVDACIGRIDAGQPLPEVLDHARKSVGAVIDACMPG